MLIVQEYVQIKEVLQKQTLVCEKLWKNIPQKWIEKDCQKEGEYTVDKTVREN